MLILLTPIAGLVALAFSGYLTWTIIRQPLGTEAMQKIYQAIRDGSKAYLKRQYKTISIISIILTIILYFAFDFSSKTGLPLTAFGFLLGAIFSLIAGYVGMDVATRANVRTAYAARLGTEPPLKIAFYGGLVMGLFNVALSLLGVTGLFYLYGNDPKLIVGFGFGASLSALFAQLGGGIYTKAADVGADLVGKIEKNIPEDDPRNPAVIADQVGDNVGDVAGRGIFFSHRDLDWILDKYENGEKFLLYTGRGPSGHTHLGHLIPWIFTKWLQEKFDAELYFQMTDDEKFLVKDLTLKQTIGFTYDNVLDLIALGFDPKKTFIFSDIEYAKTLYNMAVRISKHLTFSTVKAVFGFKNESNIGIIFFPAMQIAPCFFPSELKGKNIPCLIPAAIDQDPYWRPARDVAPKMGFYKPAQIHNKFIPGLGPGGKMSASDPNTAVFTTDSPEVAEKKITNAFTGQQATAELQRKLGGNPEICSVCQYYYYFFEQDDKKVQEIFAKERSGELLAGEHKADLAERVKKFLIEHQKKREKAKDQIDKFMLRD